jgi:hypothetical protein
MTREEIILTEYQKAQDSAEHYNTMVWTLFAVGVGFALIMLKVTLLDLKEEMNLLVEVLTLKSLILFLGAASLTYFGSLIRGADQKKHFKYEICKKIELENKNFIGQNLGTEFLPLTQDRWGTAFLYVVKNTLLLFFLAFASVVLAKSVNTNQFGNILILYLGTLIVFFINIFLDVRGTTKFESVLLKIDEKRKQKTELKKEINVVSLDKRTLAISVAGGLVSGGCLLAYQILLDGGWNPLLAGVVAVIVAWIIYKMALKKVEAPAKS